MPEYIKKEISENEQKLKNVICKSPCVGVPRILAGCNVHIYDEIWVWGPMILHFGPFSSMAAITPWLGLDLPGGCILRDVGNSLLVRLYLGALFGAICFEV